MVFVQNCPFIHLFTLGTLGQENIFYDILERKNPFLGYKNKKLKKKKIHIFQRGLTHGFGPKTAIFPTLFFLAIYARKILFTIF